MTESLVRWGICGCGSIAHRMARALAQIPGHRLGAVAARDPHRAAVFAADHGHPQVRETYRELLADPLIDVVYIATIHNHHYPLILQALNSGKAVVCEKPLVMTEGQARAVVDLARAKNRLLIEALWVRFQPAVLQLHAAIAAGRLGRLTMVRSDFSIGGDHKLPDRKHDLTRAGGALLDLGIYPLALAQDFLGPIAEIVSLGEVGGTGVDENLGFVTRHVHGGLGIGTAGLRGVGTIAMEIYGSEALAVSPCACPPREITLRTGWGNQTLEVLRDDSGVDGFVHTVRETGRCLAEGRIESPRMTHAQSIELAHFLEVTWRKTGVAYPEVDLAL